MAAELNKQQPTEPSVSDLRTMLIDPNATEPNKVFAPAPEAEPGKPAEGKESQPAKPEGEARPAEKPAEQPSGEKAPAPGTGEADKAKPSQEQEQKPEAGSKKQFEPKEGEVPEGVQKRINKAIWEKHEAERRAQEAQREAEDLKRKLAEKDQASGKPAAAEAAAKPAAGFAEPEPKEDDFESYGAYTKALSSWQYRKDAFEDRQARAAEEAKAKAEDAKRQAAEAGQKLTTDWNQRVAKVAESNPAIGPAIEQVGPFVTQAGQADLIMQSEVGPEIVLYMHEHAEETLGVAKTGSEVQLARYIGRIEAKLLAQKEGSAPAPKQKTEPVNKPLPEPIAPVGGKNSPPAAIDLNDPKISQKDFREEFDRQLRAVAS